MRPPPGGDPYFATSSGAAIMLDLPKTRLFMVVGTLYSSTQMYSGSLGTSPKRGFLIRSHLGSVGLRVTLGSFCLLYPASSRTLTHPPAKMPATHRPTRSGRTAVGPFMSRPSIADPPSISLEVWVPTGSVAPPTSPAG